MSLLTHVKTIKQPKSRLFNASQFFVEEKQPDGIKFYLGYNFKEYFLKGTEIVVSDGDIQVYMLNKYSVDEPIIKELGGEKQAETSLFHLAEFIRKQPKGEKGELLTDGQFNIFYIRGSDGELWAVHCSWSSGRGHWGVHADPVAFQYGWGAGRQVFSRGSLVTSDTLKDELIALSPFDPSEMVIKYKGKTYKLVEEI
jgi:hypothetical protein